MTMRTILSQYQFEVDRYSDNQDFPTFVRVYDAALMAAFFNQFTGEFYMFEFNSDSVLFSYKTGTITMDELMAIPNKYGIVHSVTTMVNMNRIQTVRDFKKAFEAMESLVENIVLSVDLKGFKIGDRVIIDPEFGQPAIGTIVKGVGYGQHDVLSETGMKYSITPAMLRRIESANQFKPLLTPCQ